MPAFDIYDGDAALDLGPEGADMLFTEGQPEMDPGLQNEAFISLLTMAEWCGNAIAPLDEKIGSSFIAETRKAITRSQLERIKQAAKAALKGGAFGSAQISITNPQSLRIEAFITLGPEVRGGGLTLSGAGNNWIAQAIRPSYRRLG